MKIGLVCSEPMSLPGGIQKEVKDLYRYLRSKGHDVKILAPKHKKGEKYNDDVIFLGMCFAFDYGDSKINWSMIYENGEIDKILDREKFDILHFHSIGLFSTLQILKRSKSKNLLTYHILPEKSLLHKIFANSLLHLVKDSLGKFDVITIPSRPVLKYIPKEYAKKTIVVPNAVDLGVFKPMNGEIKRFDDGKLNILFLGRLDKRKGLEYLIRSYENLKKLHENMRLIVVGDGYTREKNERIVKKNGIRDVAFEGFVKDDDIPKYYSTCDIFCAPTLNNESFGLTIAEAVATGKPVVATNITGYKEVFGKFAGVRLVRPKSSRALSQALEDLITDDGLRERMGNENLKAAGKYSWNKVGERFLEIYENLLNGKPKR